MEQQPLRARMAHAAVCMLYTLTDGIGAPTANRRAHTTIGMEQQPLRARMAHAAVCRLYTLTDGTGAPQRTPVTPNPTGVYVIHPCRVKGLETGRKMRRPRARYKHIALWQ